MKNIRGGFDFGKRSVLEIPGCDDKDENGRKGP